MPQSFEDDASHSHYESDRNEAEQSLAWDILYTSGVGKQGTGVDNQCSVTKRPHHGEGM